MKDNSDLLFENADSVVKMVITNAEQFGADISTVIIDDRVVLPTVTIIFNSVEDLNLYKLVGKYEEAPYLAFDVK